MPGLLRYALLAAALLYFLQLLLLVPFRVAYPYDLEWMEGAFVDHVRRVLSGQPLYVNPSFEFTPLIYPPLYFYLSALVSGLLGEGYLPLRLLTSIASLGCFALLYRLARRETGSAYYGAISAALYAACYGISGGWFDLARLDSLLIFLLLAGFYLLRFYPSATGACLAGAVLALASLTKQTALVVTAPLLLCLFYLRGVRIGLCFTGTYGVLLGGATAALHLSSQGWFTYYTFILPGQHPFFTPMLLLYWTRDLFLPLPVALLLVSCLVFFRLRRGQGLRNHGCDPLLLQLTFLGAMLLVSWLGRLHIGGGTNAVLPAYAALALFFGMGLQSAFSALAGDPGRGERRYRDKAAQLLLYAAAIFQLGWLAYDRTDYLPTSEDAQAGERFVRALSSIEGELYAPDHGYLPSLAGKQDRAHVSALWSIWAGKEGRIKRELNAEITAALRERRFAAIVIAAPALTYPPFMKMIEKYYRRKRALLEADRVYRPVDFRRLGIRLQSHLYLPR